VSQDRAKRGPIQGHGRTTKTPTQGQEKDQDGAKTKT